MLNNNLASNATKKKTLSTKAKWTLTGAIYLCYIIYGMGVSLVGPALLDLSDQVGASVDDVSSKGLVAQAVFYTISALGGGILCRYVNRQWFLIVCVLLCAVTQVWAPLAESMLMLSICLCISGAFGSGIDLATNAWLLAIWREGSTHLMQGLHCCWALGSAIGPQIIAPYLSIRNETMKNNDTKNFSEEKYLYENYLNSGILLSNNFSNENILPKNETLFESESRIYVIYYTSAALYLIVAAILICLYFFVPYDESNESKNIQDAVESSGKFTFSKSASATIIGVAIAIICFDAGAEMSTFDYNTAMIHGLGFPKKLGAYISSARGYTFTAARAIAAMVAIRVPIKVILMFSMFTLLGANILLAFAAMQQHILSVPMADETVKLLLWIGFSLMGFGFGPIYPGTMSYTEKYVKLTDFTCGLFVSVGSINIILNLVVVGKYLEQMPVILIYNVFVASIVMISFMICLMVIIRKTGRRVQTTNLFTMRKIND